MDSWAAKRSGLLRWMLVSSALFLVHCGQDDQDSNQCAAKGTTPVADANPESSVCTTVTNYPGGVDITGSAVYQYRPVTTNGLGSAASKPIRHAEVRVTDSNGTLIQCGTTDSSGNISLKVPTNTSGMTLAVTSRIAGSAGYASVLSNPTSNTYYSLTTSLTTATSNVNIGTLTASVDTPGGAFNILDRIVDANAYLTAQVSTSNCATFGCTAFPNNQKVQVYWKLGENPAEYFNSSAQLSFYVPGTKKLYILGGNGGELKDYRTSDTDHYDNSVILHEYAHFLEDVYSKSDSPGGSHSANGTIDARLAWGEGLANFFQGAVLNESCRSDGTAAYCDTRGNPDGTTGLMINYSLETQDSVDMPNAVGEGNFREFSISRFLFDMVDDNSESGDSVNALSFAEVWSVLTGGTFLGSSTKFRNAGLFHELHSNLSGAADISSLYTLHKHDNDQGEYGVTLTTGSCTRDLGTTDTAVLGSFSSTNHLSANDFFRYHHSGGSLEVTLDYTTNGNYPADLDLYIYLDGYTYGDDASIAAFSEQYHTSGTTGSEMASGTLCEGDYIINVRQFKYVKDNNNETQKATYRLKINGVERCPSY